MIFQLLGGIGLFLLGMVLLTDGLKAFAGEALRQALVRFTGTPLKAFGSGTLVTLMVQSSSATTVTLIGFVSAGLLTFPQAVGVVFGASLGTTGTGWIVSILGLKVSLGAYALPLVGIGAFLKLLARGRWQSFGLALAGFGLIFVGIETLQQGMQQLSGRFDPASLPSGGLTGHLLAMLIGIAMTVIMQSSSAAVATTLTALHTATINFEQAASLVIGAAVGTTITGVLAAIGGTTSAKRTALAHVIFNLATGLIALLLLPLLLWSLAAAQIHLGLEPGATSLAAFHTTFIALGVLVFLPFVNGFSRWIEHLLPERGPHLTRHLDDTLLHSPAVALEATQRALRETACELFDALAHTLRADAGNRDDSRHNRIADALERTQQFFSRIPPVVESEPLAQQRVAQMHVMDHLLRLEARLRPPPGVHRLLADTRLQPVVARARIALDLGIAGLRGSAPADWLDTLGRQSQDLAALRLRERPAVLGRTASGASDPAHTLDVLDTMRWLERVGHHTWRICNYLDTETAAAPALESPPADA